MSHNPHNPPTPWIQRDPTDGFFEDRSGFFKLTDPPVVCADPEHEPPSMLYVPPGEGYRHVCPTCKKVTIITNPVVH